MLISYIKYRLKAQGKYRLHSPFVFDFYEEVLDKMNRGCWREELNKRFDSFLLSKNDVFCDEDEYLIKYDIHHDKNKEQEWTELIGDNRIKLSIDCYYFGVAFKMKRKEKQCFVLKF